MDETSNTTPGRYQSSRGADRIGTLALVGSAGNAQALASARLVTLFGSGAEIGRRPPPGRMRTVVTLGDRSVSNYHAQITSLTEGFIVEDKGSTNGTMLAGHPVTKPTALRDGAVLFLGSQVVVFRTMSTAEIAAVEADAADPFAPVATLFRGPPMKTQLRRRVFLSGLGRAIGRGASGALGIFGLVAGLAACSGTMQGASGTGGSGGPVASGGTIGTGGVTGAGVRSGSGAAAGRSEEGRSTAS